MENFMDRLYSRINTNGGQQYSASAEPRRREAGDNKIEQLMNLIKENDSKQIECIAAMFNQESIEYEQSKNAIEKSLKEMSVSIQQAGQNTQGLVQQSGQDAQASLQAIHLSLQDMDASIRTISENVQQMHTEQSYEQTAAGGITTEQLQDLEEHVHKENVKCYRNVQASVMEQAELQMEQTRTSVGSVKGMLITSLILNVATIAILIVHLLGVI